MHPTQVLVVGLASFVLMGSLLLNLPVASVNGESLGFINALFTATSAVCVTGLTVVDTGTYFSMFGQIVILILIQFGGLGFMTIATSVFLLARKQVTLRERLVIQESLNEPSLAGMVRLIRNILLVTFLIEGVGALFLSIRFIPIYGFVKGIYFGLFHAISSFCNAGFDLIGNGVSLIPFIGDPIINITIMGLIVLGGLGFAVILEVYKKKKFKLFSLHTKVVLLVTVGLILSGFLFFFIMEVQNPKTFGAPGLTLREKLFGSMFQSVTARTAGYFSVNNGDLTFASRFMTIILMFIGASPASTGGGVKTTTFSVSFFLVLAVIRGRKDVELFGKRLPNELVFRALAIMMISITLVITVTMLLTLLEADNPNKEMFSFINMFFEATSAFGTVGLTTGITPYLSDSSKLLLCLTMFTGRIGPLTLAFAFAKQLSRNNALIRYPEDKIMVG